MQHKTAFIFLIAGLLVVAAAALDYRQSRQVEGCPFACPGADRADRPEVDRAAYRRAATSTASARVAKAAEATKTWAEGIDGEGRLYTTIWTSLGNIDCELHEAAAPVAVDNFIGLAKGWKPFRDPASGEWVRRPFYDGLTFHRVVPGFLIQAGDPTGKGTYTPGYGFDLELAPGLTHDAGTLGVAHHGEGSDGVWTNGSQFYITTAAARHLDGHYTIFGQCDEEDLERVRSIANVPTGDGARPLSPVMIEKVGFWRSRTHVR